jgi:hypothetical protein
VSPCPPVQRRQEEQNARLAEADSHLFRSFAISAIQLRGELDTTLAPGNIETRPMAVVAGTAATLGALEVAPARAHNRRAGDRHPRAQRADYIDLSRRRPADRGGAAAEAAMSDAMRRSWCDRSFRPRQSYGHAQRFCPPSCRRAFHTASLGARGYCPVGALTLAGENCKAFLKLGPPWWNGWLWVVRGWLCGVQGNSVQDRDLQSFVDALVVKVP